MLKLLKSPQENSSAWCSASDKLQLAEDTLSAVRSILNTRNSLDSR